MSLAAGTRLGPYEIQSAIGAGGMGEVFKARDTRLDRLVAIKLLPARFTADAGRLARFSNEARAASALSHPNIITIHEVGDADGLPFIVMEFVEGETLRDAVRRGPLPIRRLLDIGAQVAEGLAKAHAAGIVHRDLKPENVMVTADGFAKILDFGLAKLQPSTADLVSGGGADEETQLPRPTADGVVLGTVGYMSPEQASGRTVDFRTDQFSLGSILYEMATGRQAFHGSSAVETLHAIIADEPKPLADLSPALPAPARWVVERCLAKDPGQRYASTLDLAHELRGLREHLSEASDTRAFERPRPSRRFRLWHAIVVAVTVAIVVLAGPAVSEYVAERLHRLPIPSEKRIAVLPIHNPGGNAEDRATCDGLLDYVVARLGSLERYQRAVAVVPATEVRQSGVASATDARRRVGATLAVEMSVQRSGMRTVMAISLVDTARRRQLRAATRQFDAQQTALLDQAVDAVVAMLDLELGDAERSALRAGSTTVARASALYAQGVGLTPYQQARNALDRADQQQGFEQAIALFNRALELDSRFALAHAGLGDAHLGLYRLLKRPEDAQLAEAHCRRAIELDDLLPRAWLTLGSLHTLLGKTDEALDELSRAAARNPRDGRVHNQIAYLYQRLNRIPEAEDTYRKALALAGDSWVIQGYYGAFLVRRSKYVEAEKAFQAALALAPDNPGIWSNLGGVYVFQGRHAEAKAALEKAVAIRPTANALSNLGTILFGEGQREEAVRRFDEATKVSPRDYRLWHNLASTCIWVPAESARAGEAFRKAADLAEEERRLDPANGLLLAQLADCRARLGEASAARRLLPEALRVASEDAQVAETVAGVYEDLGDRDQALQALGRALRLGYSTETIERSPTFERLRADPRYKALKHSQAAQPAQGKR
jgi:eukaryotic-like serine/threonine-protein kinase